MPTTRLRTFFTGFLAGLRAFGRHADFIIDDAEWQSLIESRVVLRRLPLAEQTLLRDLTARFLGTKYLEAVQGLELRPVMSLAIATWACLPILGLGLKFYRDWHNLFISPGGFVDRQWKAEAGGVITEWNDELSGEVLELGPVVLSWSDVSEAGSGHGYNVVIHEMAHKLDGLVFGVEARRQLIHQAWEDFGRLAARQERRRSIRGVHKHLPLDDYAASSPEEFFAVATENFFERPLGLRVALPAVYDCLKDCFKLDPALWS